MRPLSHSIRKAIVRGAGAPLHAGALARAALRVLRRAVRVGAAAALVAVGFGGSAFASSLTMSAGNTGTGSASVTDCGRSSWALSESPTSSTATKLAGVTVSGISSGCETNGDTLEVVAAEGSSVATGALALSSVQTSYTVTFSSCTAGATGKCTGSTALLTLAAVTSVAASVSGP